jgi:hypothetical protein
MKGTRKTEAATLDPMASPFVRSEDQVPVLRRNLTRPASGRRL